MRSCCKASSTFILILLSLLAAVLSLSGSLAAQENPQITKPIPLYSSEAVASVPTPVKRLSAPEAAAGESRVETVRKRFQAIIEQQGRSITEPGQDSKRSQSNSLKVNTRSQNGSRTGQAITPAGSELDVHYRSFAGTPRQIKMKVNETTGGPVGKLRKAMEGMAPGKDRDERTARAFLKEHSGLLRLSDTDKELQLKRHWTDDLGRRHLRYDQNYKGIPVWPAELNVHLDAQGNVELVNGAYVATPRKLVYKPVVSQERAEMIAANHIPGSEPAQQVTSKLIVYAPGSSANRLSWKVRVLVNVASDWVVVVDALNGNILTAYNQVKKDAASGSGMDLTNVTRNLNLWYENDRYYLIDTSKSMYDGASDPPDLDQTNGAIFVFDMGNNELPDEGSFTAQRITSTSNNSGWLEDGVSLAYNLSQAYDYYKTVHNRDSIDDNGGNIVGFVRVGSDFDNAFWTSEYNALFFGDAKIYAAALDVVGHELTHGITSFTCNLVYQDQPGALNEAFSDIFGEMVEAHAVGSTDWINGTVFNDDSSRNLKDPSSVEIIPDAGYYYPSKMSEFYQRGSGLLQMLQDEDYGGVHINMTIVTHAFYLLAEGLNDAIGLSKAAEIFYRAQTVHLVTNSQFIDMRLACIQSAEELYGSDSIEAQKVAEAFDAVEIVDDNPTPEPGPSDPVSGDDSYIFVSYNPNDGNYYLARREIDQGDNEYGSWLSSFPVKRARPSVSGDGDTAFFVDAANDACFLNTDGSGLEDCLGFPDQIHSVAMSPDEQVYGFVMLDDNGEPMDNIWVIDLRTAEGTGRIIDLTAPGTEGYTVQTVVYADTIDFTSDNRYLMYDAFNILELTDGTQIGVWSIYAIDLENEQTFSLLPPTPGYDIGYPSLSQTSDHLMTWDQYNDTSGVSTLAVGNLISGDAVAVGTVDGDYGVPGYNGDDSAIAYEQLDAAYPTGYSMDLQPLGEDRMTPVGSPSRDLVDAEFGVIYRRGAYSVSVPDISISPANVNFNNTKLNEVDIQTISINNNGGTNLMIENIDITGTDKSMFTFKSSCIGQRLPAGASCSVGVGFTPTSLDKKTAMLTISSDDPDTPAVDVPLAGTGISKDSDGSTDGNGNGGDGGGGGNGGGGGGGGCMINTLTGGIHN